MKPLHHVLADVFTDARDKVASGYMTGTQARNAKGAVVRPLDPDATKWSAAGALSAATGRTSIWVMAVRVMHESVGGPFYVWSASKSRTQQEVIDVFEQAVAKFDNDMPASAEHEPVGAGRGVRHRNQ